MKVTHHTTTKVDLEFFDWVRRASTPPQAVEALHNEFLAVPEKMTAAFGIRVEGGTINFSWDTWVIRAVKG